MQLCFNRLLCSAYNCYSYTDRNQYIYIDDTEQLREEFRGRGMVCCPECGQDVAWVNIMSHRLETCKEKRV